MRFSGAIFAVLLTVSAEGQQRLVLPPQVAEVARAHHCQPVTEFVTDEESNHAAPFELTYEFKFDPPKAFLTAWCAKDAPAWKGINTLLVWAERPDHPLRSCPDEIPTVTGIGHPTLDAGPPMVPHDFVMIDTGERPTVRESRIMFGVRNHHHSSSDFYACVAGRWAHYSPEKK
jgi:hypothetical protein